MRSGMLGHPSQAMPTAVPAIANRTASLVRNTRVGRWLSAAPTATSSATVTRSASSSPVMRLMAALLSIAQASAVMRLTAATRSPVDDSNPLQSSPTETSGEVIDVDLSGVLACSGGTAEEVRITHRTCCTAQLPGTTSGLRPISRASVGGFAHSDQSVPHRKQRGRAPAADAELGVDVLHVGADRLGRYGQVLRDLLLAHPPREQHQQLDL